MRRSIFRRPAATTCSGDPAATLIMKRQADPSDTVIIFGVDGLEAYVMTDQDTPFDWARFWKNFWLSCAVASILIGAMLVLGGLLADSWVGQLVSFAASLL